MKTVAVLSTPNCVGQDTDANMEICQGRLPNSIILANLDAHLSYLDSPKHSHIIDLIQKHSALLSDVPTQTNALGLWK